MLLDLLDSPSQFILVQEDLPVSNCLQALFQFDEEVVAFFLGDVDVVVEDVDDLEEEGGHVLR